MGDDQVQEDLLMTLREQISREKLKDEVKEDVTQRIETLRKIGQELQEELDEEYKIERFRTELASQHTLSETMSKFNALEDEVNQIKEQIKADQEELERFEQMSAEARSQGLFFQSLYQASGKKPSGGVDQQQTTGAIKEVTEAQTKSSLRLYLFLYMTLILALAVIQDLTSSTPSLGLDGLYLLLGVALGSTAWNERQALPWLGTNKQDNPLRTKEGDDS